MCCFPPPSKASINLTLLCNCHDTVCVNNRHLSNCSDMANGKRAIICFLRVWFWQIRTQTNAKVTSPFHLNWSIGWLSTVPVLRIMGKYITYIYRNVIYNRNKKYKPCAYIIGYCEMICTQLWIRWRSCGYIVLFFTKSHLMKIWHMD